VLKTYKIIIIIKIYNAGIQNVQNDWALQCELKGKREIKRYTGSKTIHKTTSMEGLALGLELQW